MWLRTYYVQLFLFNLVYLASMSVLDTPPGATWKKKFFIIAQLYGNSMEAIMSWTWEGHTQKSEWRSWVTMTAQSSTAEMKCRCAPGARCLPGAWYQPSPYLQDPLPSALPSPWKVWGRVLFSEGSLVASYKNPNFSAYVILNYFGRKELNASAPSVLCYLYLTPSKI